jgi:hypothetical protein
MNTALDRKNLLIHLALLIVSIFFLNFFANKFDWYSSIWYFDIIMHFLGGFWVGLLALYFFSSISESFRLSREFKALPGELILKKLFFVFVIGIGWEIFEFIFTNIIAQIPFDVLDTLSDISFDVIGGLCVIIYLWKKTQKKISE